MRKFQFVTVAALLGVMASSPVASVASEYDFIGYDYSQDYKRDYDRGFFLSAEAWFANARNLHFEPALTTAGSPAPTGGRLLDVDFDFEVSPRVELGYQANRRVGRFTLRYSDFHETASRAEIGSGIYAPTGAHPSRGPILRDSFIAEANVDAEWAEIEWRKDFGQGRKFTSYLTTSIHAFEIEYETNALFYNKVAPDNGILISDFTSTSGIGGKVGLGGRYQFTNRFSMGGYAAIGYSSNELDYQYLDKNTDTGNAVAFINRADTEQTSLLFEGDLGFSLRIAGGFDIDWGYHYVSFEDVIAADRFVDAVAKTTAVEQQHGIAFEGPYIRARWTSGLGKIDSDGDGVLDTYDDCPDTPAGAWVNEQGCPRDMDEDGVYDGIDRCPGTQFGTRVDEWGCGVDTDGDGVADGLDLCPNSPDCSLVDGNGCPKDSDDDGVANGCDACPGTAMGATVDGMGCQTDADSDGDTVPDSRDNCPNSPRGAAVDQDGCSREVSMMLEFNSNSADITGAIAAQLDRIAWALSNDGGRFEIQGHTDDQNTVEYNQSLSDRRAAAVMNYLTSRGVSASSLTAVGYSELRPIADNSSAAGRKANRRVEIVRR